MNYLKENWRWILFPIVAVLIIACVMIVLSNRDGLDSHRYDLGLGKSGIASESLGWITQSQR